MRTFRSSLALARVLLVDAGTCAAMGAVLSLASGAIGDLTGIPEPLLRYAGLSLFPIAAFIALVALRRDAGARWVWLVIFGNVLWVAASLALLLGVIAPNPIGVAFIVVQALAVSALTWLEVVGLRPGLSRPATS
jgi:hypothetical protein